MKSPLVPFKPKSFIKLLLIVFCFSAAVAINAQPRPMRPRTVAPPTGNSTVNGRVVYKDNGQPLKNTRVSVFTTGEEIGNSGLVAFTNSHGEFHLEKLAAGKYYVKLEGPGLAMQSGFGMKLPTPMAAIPRPEDYPEIIPKHDGEFTVDGTNTVGVEVRIARGGTISGKVLKPNGGGIANIPVTLISREGKAGPYTTRFSAQTDKDGAYKVENIPSGEYLVSAAVEDKRERASFDMLARLRGESQVATYHPAATTIRDALPVRVDPGRETSGVNVTLVARNAFAVSGTVVQQRDGTPLAGATVLLRNKESELAGSLVPGMGQRTTRADADGHWSFSNVMEGSYVVTALLERSARGTGADPSDRAEAFRRSRQRFLVAQQEVNVVGANLEGLVMAISGPGTIVGRVELDNGEPLPAGLVIFLEFAGASRLPSLPLPVRVGSDGTFRFENVQGGEVFVGVALGPGSKYFVKSQTANGDDLSNTPLKVIEGTDAGPIQVVLSPGVGSLTGRVTAENGREGLSDVVVLLAPTEPGRQRFRTAYLATQTAPDGSYSIVGAPGEYFVFARRREDLPPIVSAEFVRNQAANAPRVTLGAGEQKRLELRVQ